jgi:hypothetical protein
VTAASSFRNRRRRECRCHARQAPRNKLGTPAEGIVLRESSRREPDSGREALSTAATGRANTTSLRLRLQAGFYTGGRNQTSSKIPEISVAAGGEGGIRTRHSSGQSNATYLQPDGQSASLASVKLLFVGYFILNSRLLSAPPVGEGVERLSAHSVG